MERKSLSLLAIFFTISLTLTPLAAGYSSDVIIGSTIEWRVEVAPNDAFNMYYSEAGFWVAENGSSMTFSIQSIGEDIVGRLTIGNISVIANDTEIAKDLTLGVWGTPTEWWPGLIVDVGQESMEILNETAYASAERVSGNYLNGTMTSRYENISVDNTLIECIVFDYEQDSTGFGEPQMTHLAYSLTNGVLIEARTSYSFGVPYNLEISIMSPEPITDDGWIILYPVILLGILLVVLVVAYMVSHRR
ncbi:MAG: hypothetical protein ACFFDQ_03000 [Candidatus Thorarchaeota archaeon]